MLEMSEIPDEKIKLSVFEWPELKKVEAIFTMWNKKNKYCVYYCCPNQIPNKVEKM